MRIEPGRTSRLRDTYPDRLQQILNRLQRLYNHLGMDERRRRVIEDIKKMDLTEAERRELLRRLRRKRPLFNRTYVRMLRPSS